ncbi:MAG: TRAP transporter fused permease subunit [Paracoccaceae bacterium]
MSQSDTMTASSLSGAPLPLRALTLLITAALVIYSCATVWSSLTGAMEHYTIHVTLIFALVLSEIIALRYRDQRFMAMFAGVMLIGIITCGLYFVSQAKVLEFSQPFISNTDFVFGLMLVAIILCVAWMTWGAALALICLFAALYFAFGHMLPEAIATNRKYEPTLIISYLAGMGGPRGILNYAPLSADVIFLLLVYGGTLHGTRIIDMFGEIGLAIGNLFRGGVAYSAVTASLLIGMVTGQSVSNIALSGSMTIPTMTRTGFTRNEAGAIEVLASTGSQLLPPIMGLGAFLMSVILGVSYIEIAIAAIVPAILYLVAVVAGIVCLIAASKDIPFERQKVDWNLIGWVAPSFVISFLTLILLLSWRYSAPMGGFWGIILAVGLSFLRPRQYRPKFTELSNGFVEGALAGAKLTVILSAIGIIVQMLVTTGTGLSLGRLMIETSRDNLTIGLLLGMAVSLVIGMGLPTPAAYALIAIVVVPSLIDLGIEPLVANFYGFYFAIFSTLSPPVAVGILTAIRISNGSFMGTAWECFKLGGVCFLVPFLFVAFPNVLGFPNLEAETFGMIGAFFFATIMLSAATYGAIPGRLLEKPERLIVAFAGPGLFVVTLFMSGAIFHLITPICFGLWMLWHVRQKRTAESLA